MLGRALDMAALEVIEFIRMYFCICLYFVYRINIFEKEFAVPFCLSDITTKSSRTSFRQILWKTILAIIRTAFVNIKQVLLLRISIQRLIRERANDTRGLFLRVPRKIG